MGGAIFKTAVLMEIIKTIVHRGQEPQVYFCDAAGVEVDIVVAEGALLIPLAVKLSATPRWAMAPDLAAFQKDLEERATVGYVIHPGGCATASGAGVIALPFSDL